MFQLKSGFIIIFFTVFFFWPFSSQALTLEKDILVKGSSEAVYYYAINGKRYVFPNKDTYFSWFTNFSKVFKISDVDLAAMPLGGNVTYRPGIKMLKIQTDPKVYAVDRGATLRWVISEAVAAELYGNNWVNYVNDVSVVYFSNYKIGDPIYSLADFNPEKVAPQSSTINQDKFLADTAQTLGSDTILNLDRPPVIDAGEDKIVRVNQEITFRADGSINAGGNIVEYFWDFGDGTTGFGSSITHVFNSAGSFTVILRVTNIKNMSSADSFVVNVIEPLPKVTVFFDSFEEDEWNGKWTDSSNYDWRRKYLKTFNGSFSAEADGPADDSGLISAPINLQGRTRARVSFYWQISESFEIDEYLAFDISTDNGVTWQEKAKLKGDFDTKDVWLFHGEEINNINNLRLRFRASMSSSAEDANIDLVTVVAG